MPLVDDFAKAPRAFLSSKVIVVDEDGVISHENFKEWRESRGQMKLETQVFPAAGIHRFTLVEAFNNVVLLRPHDGKGGPGMRAHWLPWKSGDVTSYDLDDKAPLFFTSQLTGCRLSVLPDPHDKTKAKVAHLAGNMPRGAVDRNQAEKQLFPGDKPRSVDGRTRRFSFSGDSDYKRGSSFIIGYITPSGWKFCAQIVDGESTAFNIKISDDIAILNAMKPILR